MLKNVNSNISGKTHEVTLSLCSTVLRHNTVRWSSEVKKDQELVIQPREKKTGKT